jgi:hypothetical protein
VLAWAVREGTTNVVRAQPETRALIVATFGAPATCGAPWAVERAIDKGWI